MKDIVSIGIVGLGRRGNFTGKVPGLLHILAAMKDVKIVSVCDEYQDRVDSVIAYLKENNDITASGTTDYMDIVNNPEIDAVMVFTAWEMHVPISIAAMKAGKAVGVEVGGAYSVEDCFRLVRTQEETGAHFMMLENCCYDRPELLVLDMVRRGLFGEIVHCTGGYHHDIRRDILNGEELKYYRLRNYLSRNCDNYPTHQLGPIAKILDINDGNRMVSLVSMASKSAGLNELNKTIRGEDHKLSQAKFAQGDIITTIIKCARGETITLALDTTLPRPYYSRGFSVRGTKGAYLEETKTVYIDNETPHGTKENIKEFHEKYPNPIWKEYDELGIEAGHGGMDWHVLRAFIESYKGGFEPPVDVYDAAAWMSISPLSEASIAMGGAVVDIPDFTGGRWIKTHPKTKWKYSL